jgi:Domain of unknown function (DUF4055)
MPTATTQTSPQQSTAGHSAVLSTLGDDTADIDRPDWRDPLSRAQLAMWRKCRDAYEGTDALLDNPTRYLPKHKKEKPEDYRLRCEHSAVFNAYGAVVTGLVGLAFAKPPTLGTDVPQKLRDHAENIDGRGTHLNQFASDLTEELISMGSAGFMVLYPPRPAGATAYDEKNGVLRPYWNALPIENILSWQFAQVGARDIMTQLVFEEEVRARAGRFGIKSVKRYRVFVQDVEAQGLEAPVLYEVWERSENDRGKVRFSRTEQGTLVNGRNKPFSRIPYVPVVRGRRTSPISARPPLKDLLDLMLKAFRIDSDRTYLMHLGCVPIPVRKGYQAPKDKEGNAKPAAVAASNVLMDLPADTPQLSGVGFSWAEIKGTAFEPTKDELEKLKAEMGALGLSFLQPSSRAAETADARRMDQRIENATLSSMMSAVDSAIEEGFILHAEYEGIEFTRNSEKSGGSFSSNRDFERTILGADMIKVYSELVLADQLTLETFHDILLRGQALPDGFNSAQEIRRLRLLTSTREKPIDPPADDPPADDPPADPADDPTAGVRGAGVLAA